MDAYTPPTQDELDRVAAYWQRVERLTCQHRSGLTFDTLQGGPTCSDCEQPLRFLTDVQIENLRLRPPLNPDVRDRLIHQLNRGGVRFAIDGEWFEIRASATLTDEVFGVFRASDVQKMLQATEA